MVNDTCFCGEVVSAETVDTLAGAIADHFDRAHPEVGVTALHARNYLDAKERLSEDTERLNEIGPIEIHDVGSVDLGDVIGFFDRDAFAGNPTWAACYCMYHHVVGGPHDDWGDRTWQQNREQIGERLAGGATTGVVAVADGKIVGWCNATGRAAFPAHAGGVDPPDSEVGSIVCFAVAPPYRGHGVARLLLGGACDLLDRSGFRFAEAYPAAEAATAEAAYPGTIALYAGAGFSDVGGGVMRRPLP